MSSRLFAALTTALLTVWGQASPAQLPVGGGAIQLHRTRVVVRGTGTPNADPERSGPSVAVVVRGAVYLVDAGPGVVRRAAAARLVENDSSTMASLRTVFVTHLHSDHTAGLPDLMLTPWVLGRTASLRVFGPGGTSAMLDHLRRAYAEDLALRLTGGEPSNKTGHRVIARDITPGIVYRDSNVTVTAFRVDHGAWKQAYGYRFQTADRTIVVSGDTRPTDAIVNQCAGCDVLVHEVYSAERFPSRPEAWRGYHSRYHTSTAELASIATRAKPALLVLYHQLYWGDDDETLVRQVRSGYSGRVVSARDLGVY